MAHPYSTHLSPPPSALAASPSQSGHTPSHALPDQHHCRCRWVVTLTGGGGGVGSGGGSGGVVRGREWLGQGRPPIVGGGDGGGSGVCGGAMLWIHSVIQTHHPLPLPHPHLPRSIEWVVVSRLACHCLKGGGGPVGVQEGV